jgi:hypothetical protein
MKYLLSLVCFLFLSASAWADDYYAVLFAPDCSCPKYCHVWGTFVQMHDGKLVKDVTISWAPQGGWNVLDRKKPGYNMSLSESMSLSGKHATCVWGPFVISEDTFKKADVIYHTSGNYKMMDALSNNAENCIHHLSKVSGKRLITHVRYGKYAASAIYKHYCREGMVVRTVQGDMILEAIGVNRYRLRKMTP